MCGAIVAALVLLAAPASQAQDVRQEIDAIIKDYLATHPDELGEIVKSYLVKHPEAVGEIMVGVLKHRSSSANASNSPAPGGAAKAATRHSEAIADNAAALFSSPHQVTLGNPHGDVTLVEFFDYSCGFCKRALPDMLTLIKDDPNLKIVLKELPILGTGSAEAARIAVAVRMQDPRGKNISLSIKNCSAAAGRRARRRRLPRPKTRASTWLGSSRMPRAMRSALRSVRTQGSRAPSASTEPQAMSWATKWFSAPSASPRSRSGSRRPAATA